MNNFEYYNPVKIIFGEGQIKTLSELVPKDARILITFGGGSAKRTGTLDEVKTALNQNGARYILEFGGIEPNPEFDTLMKAVEIVHKEKINFLLAVGGGSVLDGTKFIALTSTLDDDVNHSKAWEALLNRTKEIHSAIPIGTVLTIPATGSEMNAGGVINNSEKKAKLSFSNPKAYPIFSILDPTKTLTLPMKQVMNGIADAFVHVIEQYLTYPVNAKVQDHYAESLLKILIEEGLAVRTQPDNMEIRKNIMWSATMALNGLIGTGVPQDWSTHAIGHELTSLYKIDHARTLTIILPALMKVLKADKREKLLQYAKNVWHISNGNEDERIMQAINKTEEFFVQLDLPIRFSDLNIGEMDIDNVIYQLKAHNMVALGEHKKNDLSVSRQILELAQ
ncbi:NADH-dependent alcohol dehydrogenase [Mergibacter septicus]|uniref:iron-containing alcohol dehydrogenase n=1 Tax=Mergibacter septicus TaxID=221402 RepID=UPI0011796E85|nr:iron-containing alcohol dehydrogenase [Mergibacter septicus]AWX14399.1 NADH-dependent alcohol dehydrogenase [Mergibacter septicus]